MEFNLAILISGRGSNMLNIVEASKLKKIKSKVKIVISNNSSSEGIKIAQKLGMNTKIISKKNFLLKKDFENVLHRSLINQDINLICLAGFMSILSEEFLKKWENKVINIHPSLLPKFRGKNAVKQALEKKAKISGCTIHYVDKGVDTGKIIAQEKVKVLDDDDEASLTKKILKKEHKLYIYVLNMFEKGQING